MHPDQGLLAHELGTESNSMGSDATSTDCRDFGFAVRRLRGLVDLIPNHVLYNRGLEGLDADCDAYQELEIVVSKCLLLFV